MKHLAFIITLFVCTLQLHAQLTQIDYDRGYLGQLKVEALTYKHNRNTYIMQDMFNYYLVAQNYDTYTNSSYEPVPNTKILFCLGTSRHEAVKTLNDIKQFILLHRKGKGIDVLDHTGTKFHIHKVYNDEVYISSIAHYNNLIKLTTEDIKTAISLVRK